MALKLDNRSSIGTYVNRTKHVPGAGSYDPDFKKTKGSMPEFSMRCKYEESSKM